MKEIVLGNIRLICADCMGVMGAAGDGAYDLALADPDYGLGKRLRGGKWAKRWGNAGLTLGSRPDRAYFDELRRVSRNQVVWGANYFTDMLAPSRCFLVWDKKDKMPKMADCEMAWTSFDRNAKVFSSARNPGGITGKKRIHICQKPVQLYMWILGMFAAPGDSVIDTHLGSASSAIAVYEVNHGLRDSGKEELSYTGIEIDPVYFGNAVERIREHMSTHPYTQQP